MAENTTHHAGPGQPVSQGDTQMSTIIAPPYYRFFESVHHRAYMRVGQLLEDHFGDQTFRMADEHRQVSLGGESIDLTGMSIINIAITLASAVARYEATQANGNSATSLSEVGPTSTNTSSRTTADTGVPPLQASRRERRAIRVEQLRNFHTRELSGEEFSPEDEELRLRVSEEEGNYQQSLFILRTLFIRPLVAESGDSDNQWFEDTEGPDIDDITSVATDEVEDHVEQYLRVVFGRGRPGTEDDFEEFDPNDAEAVPTPGDLTLVEDVEDPTEDGECAICMDELRPASALEPGSRLVTSRLVVCTHLFHRKCIEMWLGTRNTCPICRARITRD